MLVSYTTTYKVGTAVLHTYKKNNYILLKSSKILVSLLCFPFLLGVYRLCVYRLVPMQPGTCPLVLFPSWRVDAYGSKWLQPQSFGVDNLNATASVSLLLHVVWPAIEKQSLNMSFYQWLSPITASYMCTDIESFTVEEDLCMKTWVSYIDMKNYIDISMELLKNKHNIFKRSFFP